MLLDLPIDHFRLLGVSPSADSETILRALERRLDRPPDQGFTHETLRQRGELLQLSADLLTDQARRQDYEAALLELAREHPDETAGLDLPYSREVAGLILLWEANAPHESFHLAVQAMQPPQAPALGSGREADLALLAAIACRDAARQEQDQRRYESAALILNEGQALLQRVNKLPEQRRNLEEDLEALLPYRILDLLSRDLGDQNSHQEGLHLLESLMSQRGGLEGTSSATSPSHLDQGEFELFFQQIRKFLTVQEQIDLFLGWQQSGSADAGFLAALALTAAGFSCRKPERVLEARHQLEDLVSADLDVFPMLGCLDLLLANVEGAEQCFGKSTDVLLQDWLVNHPGGSLAAFCDYCRSWLQRDVLPGYRDVDVDAVNLESWFADRDVQAYVERLDRTDLRAGSASKPSNSNPFQGWDSGFSLPSLDLGGLLSSSSELDQSSVIPLEPDSTGLESGDGSSWKDNVPSIHIPRISRPNPQVLIVAGIGLAVVAALAGLGWFFFRPSAPLNETTEKKPDTPVAKVVSQANEDLVVSEESSTRRIEPITSDDPTELQLKSLLTGWLAEKAAILSVGEAVGLGEVARQSLVNRVLQERRYDAANGQTQKIQASIQSLRIVSRSPQRIEAKAEVSYSDERLDNSGAVIDKTSAGIIPVTYIFGRDGDRWRLHEYLSGI